MSSVKRPKSTIENVGNTFTPSSVITAKDPTRTIVTDSTISVGSKFGPFPGKDAVESKFSNWMQYVTGVGSLDEANLVIFMCEKQLYFYCIRSIHPGMELFVWAGDKKNHMLQCQWLERETQNIACDEIYSSHFGLFGHWSTSHCPIEHKIPQKQCKCPYCPKIISCRTNLRSHVLLHLGVRKQAVNCANSRKTTEEKRQSRLQTYKQTENFTADDEDKLPDNANRSSVLCDICGRCFKMHAHLGSHKRHSHGTKE